MKIELLETTVGEVADGYVDNDEEGVVGYGGRLDIRPKYQREFVYTDDKRNAVIGTIINGYPLNVMYWAKRKDGGLEVIDGQQRTISFCSYVHGHFSVKSGDGYPKLFSNLTKAEQETILGYGLMIYVCEGDDKEKLDWFRTVNIAGERLFDQELRNAAYTGPWLASAKSFFSRTKCPAFNHGQDLVSGVPIRQDYLQTALNWISKGDIEGYMSTHQHDHNANELWMYFRNVIDWVKLIFPTYRKEMKGLDWGQLYDLYGKELLDSQALEERIAVLMEDEDVTSKKGIYRYVLTGDESSLSIREFSKKQKREAYERQKGVCFICKQKFKLEEMEGDHVTPWSQGGKTVSENCHMLCKNCNRRKGAV